MHIYRLTFTSPFSFLLPPKAEAKRGMQRRRNNRKCKPSTAMADAKSHASIKVDSGTDGIIRFQYIAFLFPAPPKAEAKRGMQRRRNNRKCKRGRLQYNAVMTLSSFSTITVIAISCIHIYI